jgi:hypothetical protein
MNSRLRSEPARLRLSFAMPESLDVEHNLPRGCRPPPSQPTLFRLSRHVTQGAPAFCDTKYSSLLWPRGFYRSQIPVLSGSVVLVIFNCSPSNATHACSRRSDNDPKVTVRTLQSPRPQFFFEPLSFASCPATPPLNR